MSKTTWEKRMEKDLRTADWVRIQYLDSRGKKRELEISLPGVNGYCAVRLLTYKKRGPTLFVKDEDITMPEGPDTDEFRARAGVPGMTSPHEYGLVVRRYFIPISRIIELHADQDWATNEEITWKMNGQGKAVRTLHHPSKEEAEANYWREVENMRIARAKKEV